MWKFRDFSASLILREINFGNSRCSKTAILAFLAALNFDFRENPMFENVKNAKNLQILGHYKVQKGIF